MNLFICVGGFWKNLGDMLGNAFTLGNYKRVIIENGALKNTLEILTKRPGFNEGPTSTVNNMVVFFMGASATAASAMAIHQIYAYFYPNHASILTPPDTPVLIIESVSQLAMARDIIANSNQNFVLTIPGTKQKYFVSRLPYEDSSSQKLSPQELSELFQALSQIPSSVVLPPTLSVAEMYNNMLAEEEKNAAIASKSQLNNKDAKK